MNTAMLSTNIIRNTQRALRPAAARPLIARVTPISGPRPQMAAFIAGQIRSFSATQPRHAMPLDNEAAEKLVENLKKAREAERRNTKTPKTTPTTVDDVKLTPEDEEADDTAVHKEKSKEIDYSKIIDYYVSPNAAPFSGARNHLRIARLNRLIHSTSSVSREVRVVELKPLPPRTPSSSLPPPPPPPPTPPAPPAPAEVNLEKLDRDVHDLRDRLDQIEVDKAIFETDREIFVRELRRLEAERERFVAALSTLECERERFKAALSNLEGEMCDIKHRLGPFHWPWKEGEMFRASWKGTKVVCFAAAGVVVVMWAERQISEGDESTPRLLGWKRM